MQRASLVLLGLLACAPKPVPEDLKARVHEVIPIDDDLAVVLAEAYVGGVGGGGEVRAWEAMTARCQERDAQRRCPVVVSERSVLVLGEVTDGPAAGTQPIFAVDRRTGGPRWRRDVPLDRVDAPADAPAAADAEHCLILDPRRPRRGLGVLVDLDCDRGDERWRRTFTDVQSVAHGQTRAAVIGGRRGPPPPSRSPRQIPAWYDELHVDSLCHPYEVRFVDLADGALTGRAPVDPVAHCQLGGRLVAISGDDLVAFDLDAPELAPSTILPDFAAHLHGVDLRRFECTERDGVLILLLGDNHQLFWFNEWLIGVDLRAQAVRWSYTMNHSRASLGEVPPGGLPPAALVTNDDGYGALDLGSGRRLGHLVRVSGVLMMGGWPCSVPGDVVQGDGVRVAVHGRQLFVHDEVTGALLRRLEASAGSGLLGATPAAIWLGAEGSWPPWTRLDRATLAPLDGDPQAAPVEVQEPRARWIAGPWEDRNPAPIWRHEIAAPRAPTLLTPEIRRRLGVADDAPARTIEPDDPLCDGVCAPPDVEYVATKAGDEHLLLVVGRASPTRPLAAVRCDHPPTELEMRRFVRLADW